MTGVSCVRAELSKLPAKVQRPLSELLSIGHIDEQVMSVLLCAARQSNSESKLLGFAVGYLFLSAKGVPIEDVVRMSENLGRPINLSWSERRWRDVHNRLARAETLRRLSADVTTYAVSVFQTRLPSSFPGYVISNSRRLGMEGQGTGDNRLFLNEVEGVRRFSYVAVNARLRSFESNREWQILGKHFSGISSR